MRWERETNEPRSRALSDSGAAAGETGDLIFYTTLASQLPAGSQASVV